MALGTSVHVQLKTRGINNLIEITPKVNPVDEEYIDGKYELCEDDSDYDI